ncbi:hypothetical protein [Bartonella mastomydis]|uniref:hypothetical protein n=1 Tax=Bartonella mastomydis TaxID=1820002 RepID=UPI001FE42719|nr:hypothetical protein [Bartonella mastomydis]
MTKVPLCETASSLRACAHKSGLSHRAALSQEERALVFTRAGAYFEQQFTKEQPWLQWGQDQPLNK